MKAELRVNVTNHALSRWRQRVAVYGDAPDTEVAEAVRRATALEADEPTPFPKQPGTRYFRCADRPDVYFVTEPVAPDFVNLITVFDCSPKAAPPPKTDQVANGKGGAKARPNVPRFPVPIDREPVPSDPVNERRDFWLAAWQEAALYLGQLNRAHPDYRAWQARSVRAHIASQRLAEEYREWKRQRNRERANEEGIYREDGGINYGPAIKHLLAEVERLSDLVAALQHDSAGVPQ